MNSHGNIEQKETIEPAKKRVVLDIEYVERCLFVRATQGMPAISKTISRKRLNDIDAIAAVIARRNAPKKETSGHE